MSDITPTPILPSGVKLHRELTLEVALQELSIHQITSSRLRGAEAKPKRWVCPYVQTRLKEHEHARNHLASAWTFYRSLVELAEDNNLVLRPSNTTPDPEVLMYLTTNHYIRPFPQKDGSCIYALNSLDTWADTPQLQLSCVLYMRR